MAKDFLPTTDNALLSWAQRFSDKITATPTAFGLVAAQATAFSGVLMTFTTALAAANNPATRTRANIATKDAAKVPLVAMARNLARIVNAFPTITNAQRIELGLNPRSGTFTPIQPPTESPVLEVAMAIGRTLKLRLRSADSTRRGKPEGVNGASVFKLRRQYAAGGHQPVEVRRIDDPHTDGSRVRIDRPCGQPGVLHRVLVQPHAQSGPATGSGATLTAAVGNGIVG